MTQPQTTRNLEECTRQITRMMNSMPSDFTAVNSTLTASLFSVPEAILEGARGISVVRKSMPRRKQAREYDKRT